MSPVWISGLTVCCFFKLSKRYIDNGSHGICPSAVSPLSPPRMSWSIPLSLGLIFEEYKRYILIYFL